MRRMRKRNRAKILAAVLFMSITVSGCKVGNTEVVVSSGFTGNEVFRIKDEVCTLSEARVFLTNYQNIYANMYGVNLWKHEFQENELEDYVKDITISQLAQIMAMDFLAEEKEIALSEEEQEKIKEAAREYYDSLSDAEKEYMHVSEGDIEKLYSRYGLANKLYSSLTGDVNAEVSDDDARVMEAARIYVTDEQKANEIENQLNNGGDFMSLAGTYNEEEEIEVAFGRNDVPKEVEEAAFSLENEQVSGKIATENGWYFIKCINNYNQELTDANKSVILEQRRKEAFGDVYSDFLEELPSEFNEEAWKEVKIETNKDITTDSFFKIYEKYCNW